MITELTQSIINMTTRCGYQTYLRYIKGIIIPPGVAARKGSSTHSGIEHDYRHKIETGELAPLDEVKDATNDTFKRLIKDEGIWFTEDELPDKNKILNEKLNESIACAEFYHSNIIPIDKEIALVEKRLYADIGAGMPISGKPDVVTDGRLRDIKTGGKRWAKDRENEEIQPPIYRILLRENGFGDLPAEYIIMTNMKNGPKDDTCIWDNNLKVCGDIREANNSPEYEQSLVLRVKVIAEMIKKGDFPPAYPGAWWCGKKWCGYFSICKFVKGRIITS